MEGDDGHRPPSPPDINPTNSPHIPPNREDRRRGYKLPKEPNPHHITNQESEGRWMQSKLPRAPLNAIKIKGDQLRAAMRGGRQLDWGDIHERFVDLWQEARLVIWRAKHKQTGVKAWDSTLKKDVQTFTSDDELVLRGIEVTRGVLDSVVRLRREMGHEATGIPRWAIDRIERALREHPDALNALLSELMDERTKEG